MYPVEDTIRNGNKQRRKSRWYRHGAAWTNDKGTITIVLDVGVPLAYEPGAQLVLVEAKEDEREIGQGG